LTLPASQSTIEVGNGSRHQLATVIRSSWPQAQQVWLAYDANVTRHAAELRTELESAGLNVREQAIASGESQKSLAGLEELYDWLLGGVVQRQDVLVALGGGKVGDLAGFAAATVLRGIGLVQLPTTLLSMVDSSIGGKTAINHPAGKNLIGAFYQPTHVLIDPELLKSVPGRDLTSGWAEVIKHGEIQQSTPGGESGHLRSVLRLNCERLTDLQEPVLSWVIRQNLSIKAAVVMADEKESGLRGILNYGHTLGHAIEASGYRYLHGEAIAVGLVAAVRLAAAMGRIPAEEIDRVETLVQNYGLPIRAEVDDDEVMARTASDKKKSAGKQQWVLASNDGHVSIETDVPASLIQQVVQEVISP
ncbi:MAG: 3-dehydroquinate synthase, partial [Thermomicrobiales bacterium]